MRQKWRHSRRIYVKAAGNAEGKRFDNEKNMTYGNKRVIMWKVYVVANKKIKIEEAIYDTDDRK